MGPEMTSRERMLATLECKETDHIPCAFMIFFNLTTKHKKPGESVEKELKPGLDSVANVGTLDHEPDKIKGTCRCKCDTATRDI